MREDLKGEKTPWPFTCYAHQRSEANDMVGDLQYEEVCTHTACIMPTLVLGHMSCLHKCGCAGCYHSAGESACVRVGRQCPGILLSGCEASICPACNGHLWA